MDKKNKTIIAGVALLLALVTVSGIIYFLTRGGFRYLNSIGNWDWASTTTEPPVIPRPALPETAFVPRPGSDLQGYWTGIVNLDGAKRHFCVKIAEPADGTLIGALDIINLGQTNIPIMAISYTKPIVQINLEKRDGYFAGGLNPEGTAIEGTWYQGRREFPFTLKRSDPSEFHTKVTETSYLPANDNDLPGFWNGTMELRGNRLRFQLKIARVSDGNFSGWMDSLDERLMGIPMTTISFAKPMVRLEWDGLSTFYEGKLEKGRLSGMFQQKFPLDFERVSRSDQETQLKKLKQGRPR